MEEGGMKKINMMEENKIKRRESQGKYMKLHKRYMLGEKKSENIRKKTLIWWR